MFPLLVNGIPRSGTTILMHSLASHPNIVAHEDYPYETRYAIWVWHNFRVLSQPQEKAGHHWTFQDNQDYAEKNPFYFIKKDLQEYFDGNYVDLMRNIAIKQVDDYYSYLAQRYQKQEVKYFLEKFPGNAEKLLKSNYQECKSVFILRNPIDIYISVRRMNQKRNRVDFNEDKFKDPGEHIKTLIKSSVRLLKKYQQDDNTHVIKYEEFISAPKMVLESIFDFLELETNDNILSLSKKRFEDRSFAKKHSTSNIKSFVDLKEKPSFLITEENLKSLKKDCGAEMELLEYEIALKH